MRVLFLSLIICYIGKKLINNDIIEEKKSMRPGIKPFKENILKKFHQ